MSHSAVKALQKELVSELRTVLAPVIGDKGGWSGRQTTGGKVLGGENRPDDESGRKLGGENIPSTERG